MDEIRWIATKCDKGICQPGEFPAELPAKLEFAATYLTRIGLPPPPRITIALADEPNARALADGASLGAAFADHPVLVFGIHSGRPTWEDQDVVLHELLHLVTKPYLGDSAIRHPYGEAAVVEEAIADTFAALATNDPIWGERSSAPHEPARSLREVVVFPGGRTGDAHADSLAISGALWSVAQSANNDDVARSLAQAIVRQHDTPFTVTTFADAMQASLSPSLRPAWTKAVEVRHLHAFGEPIALAEGAPVHARVGAWVAPPAGVEGIRFRVAGKSAESVHLRFRAAQTAETSLVCLGKDAPVAVQEAGPFYECSVVTDAAARVAIVNRGTTPSWYDDVSLVADSAPAAVADSNTNSAVLMVVATIVLFVCGAAVTWHRLRGSSRALINSMCGKFFGTRSNLLDEFVRT